MENFRQKNMNTNKKSPGFAIIGCGRLGINLAVFLYKNGFEPKSYASRTTASAEKAKALVGTGRVYQNPEKATRAAELVFITPPDEAIASVCQAIAEKDGFGKSSTVFHLSGALSSDILVSAKESGAATGSIHPLQSFVPYKEGQRSPFKGINMSIEGENQAIAVGQKIVNALGANSFIIPTWAKILYHVSAVVASNYLVTLEDFAITLLEQTGIERNRAYEILEPLICGTLKNIKERGTINALTGPVARGDHTIVERHLKDIDQKMPAFSELYRTLGRYTLKIASRRGDMSYQTHQLLNRLFKEVKNVS